MATVRVRSRIATTHPISAYGGFQLDEEDLDEIAAALATGEMPMHISHDITRPLNAYNVEAGVERLDDGHWAAWAEFDTDADAWAEFEADRDAVGAPGGMSFSFVRPIPGLVLEEEPRMSVAADAGHFDDATITEASRQLSTLGPTQAGRLYQFAVGPDAKVIIEFVADGLAGIALNMIASALYDVAKTFLKPGRSTIFNITAKQRSSGRRLLKLHLATDDADIAQSAMEHAAEMLHEAATGTFAYDGATDTYRRVGPAESDPPADASVEPLNEPGMLERLRIADRDSGLFRTRQTRKRLLAAGGKVLGSTSDYTIELAVFSGFLARAQAFHEAATEAIEADNPHAAFTLLKAYTENTAAILYVRDNPDATDIFWDRESARRAIPIGQLVKHAKKRLPGLGRIYKELRELSRPSARAIWASHSIGKDDPRTIQ